jgi:hypothetical protein
MNTIEDLLNDFRNYYHAVFILNKSRINHYDKVICMEKLAFIDLHLLNFKKRNKGFNIRYKLLVNRFYKFIDNYNSTVELNYNFKPVSTNKNFITRFLKLQNSIIFPKKGLGLATKMERAGPCNKRGGGFGLATKMKRVEGWALQQNRKKKREGWTNRTRGLGLANRIGEDWALQTE